MKTQKKIIIISLLLIGAFAHAQKTLEGIIKDSQGTALEGASAVVKGTNIYALANADGKFSITPNSNLPFSIIVQFVGHKTQEVKITDINDTPIEIILQTDNLLDEIIVSSRRRNETAQEVPIPVTVVGGSYIANSGSFNVNLLKEVIPSVQLYSSNPRNTGINIRGLGSPFGLTNDGLDPGVGFYVDGVYYARPAAATLDFIDIDQVEVLRGPQGTLFGKNTTAGAFNITTKKPSFKTSANAEVSYGNIGYIQAKTSITGPLSKKIAGRLSFSGTQRDGTVYNIHTEKYINTLNNQGVSGKLLYKPNDNTNITLAADASKQRPDGYAQVIAGIVKTQRADYRQFNNIIKDLNYTLPTQNGFDRIVDQDTPWKSNNDLGGISLNVDTKIGKGTLTSTSAWRYWNWDPSNDRDFTGLQALAKSQNPAKHQNWSQEIRYAGNFNKKLSGVIGVFAIGQEVKISGTEESGKDQWRFVQSSNSALWQTPGLFDGYGAKTNSSINSLSTAVFGQLDWEATKNLHVLPGLRYNYDEKEVSYNRTVYGGLQTNDPALLKLKNEVYSPQAFETGASNNNISGQLTVSYRPGKNNIYATYATTYKPVGVNVAGLPKDSNGNTLLDLAVIKPEYVRHAEIGFKTSYFENTNINLSLYNTDINDYQTNVQSPEIGVNRGYIANAEKVNVKGIEFDANVKVGNNVTLFTAVSYTDGKYVKFTNAPLPLEETGQTINGKQVAFKDISGERLPGISKWAGSLGGEITADGNAIGFKGKFFFATDASYRSEFSSSPTPSKYLNIQDYTLVNARLGFRASEGITVYFWGRNIFNKDYYQQLLPAGGNAGHYGGVLGDPRTYGITLRYTL